MLRNVLSKLPGVVSRTETFRPPSVKALSRSPSPVADTVLQQRSLPRGNEGRVGLRRSHSVPYSTKRFQKYQDGEFSGSEEIQGHKSKYGRRFGVPEDASKQEPTQVCSEMTYELEAAKPKRSKSCVDVFKQMENEEFEQEMLVHLQPSMLKPFGSSQCYTPNTFSNRAQRYTTPSFKINEVLEGAKKTTEESRDTISEGTTKAFSSNSVPVSYKKSALENEPLDTLSETMSTGTSVNQDTPFHLPKTKPATKLEQESDALTTSPDEFVAEPDISTSFPKKEHIFDPTINNMTAAKKNTKWYTSEPQISINPPPFLNSRTVEEPALQTRNTSSRVIDENRLTPPFPCFAEKLKYSNTAETIAGRQTEMLSKEKVMDRTQMQTFKKGVEKMQRRGISTADGLLMKKSATVQGVAKKPSKMIDCPEEEPKKAKEEPVRMSPDGKKCFLSPKVRLKVPECMPRPKHDCPPPPCVRADECLTVRPKKLPFIPDGPCVCVEPYVPHVAPPVGRLNLTVPEPPKVCPPPPCHQQPRADDDMPHKPRQLKPYVPQPCACVEPPPMIDVPLKRLPPKCPPEEHEVCYPERICPEEVCLRADENLCVRPKKLPLLKPAECPCIEPGPMKDVPLKRLDLHVEEKPRICPCVEDCPCPRADEDLKPKFKKLRKIVPGECPCIEPSYRDVNFKRLECIDEPEPCDLTDPCIPYPRADYGCWEYYTPEKCAEAKKPAKKPKPRKIINFKPQKRCYRVEPKKSSFGVSVEKLKSNNLTRLEKNELTPHRNTPVKILIKSKVPNIPHKSGTIVLLDKLKNLQTQRSDNKIRFDRPKSSKLDVRRIMNNVSALEKENATTTASAPVRNLSTVQASKLPTMAPKKICESNVSHRLISTSTPAFKKDHKCSSNQDCGKKPKGCNKGTCPSSHTDNCPAGERRPYCKKRKVVNCCEKPPSPYPSFSELMEGQIEPFSEFSEWTCKRKEYGFYPKTTKEFEPLDIKKNKKCFSTMAFNVKGLLDESPEDLRSARGAKMNDMHVAEATSQRLDNGEVHIPFKKGNRKQRSTAGCPDSQTEQVQVIHNTGCHTVHSCPITNIRNYSSISNHSSRRNYSRYGEKDKKTSVRICQIQREKPCKCTKEKCPKFVFPNCPPKTERDCMGHTPLCCKKREAPYRAFSDCLTEELHEELSECPLSREAFERLQPIKKQAPIDDIALIAPRDPDIGKIDLAKETECVKKTLCIPKKGLSQDCTNFGKPMKTLKSKEVLADHYKTEDCLALEKERRQKEKKAAETKLRCYNEGFGAIRRDYCTKAFKDGVEEEFAKEGVDDKASITKSSEVEKEAPTLVISPNKIYMRTFHALRKKKHSQTKRAGFENQYQTPSQPPPIYEDDPIQVTQLWNFLWCIDNFNKWKKLSNLDGTIKRNYSSYEHGAQIFQSQSLSTSVTSPFIVSVPELSTSPGLSASMILANAKTNTKFGAKKEVKRYTASTESNHGKSNYCDRERKTKKCIRSCSAQVHPPHIPEDDMKSLQPRYPILPEIDCSVDKQPCPFQNCIDTTMDVEYLRQKFGVKNEGLTQDCNTFGQRISRARVFKDLVCASSGSSCCDRHCGGGGGSGADDDDDDCNRPIKDCQSAIKAVQGNANKNQCQATEDLDQCFITKEERVMRKEEKRYIKAKRDPCEKQQDICVKENTNECQDVEDPSEKKPVYEESLWKKIVNFFKARPGCPSPDEWKKKALREKAEKAAKAAGLIVCDPKDLPPDVICKCNSLPNVITTPKCEDQKEEEESKCDDIEEKEECSSTMKERNVSGVQKSCSTTAISPISKRCYSSKANSKALEEINKSLEEGEKKELAKKIVQTVHQMLNGCDGDEETGVAGNIDPTDASQNTVNNCMASTSSNESNVFSSNPEVNKQSVDMSTRLHLVRKGSAPHFLDVIFYDKVENGVIGYHRARAFAAFQEYFTKIDAVSDINHDDIEKTKTKKLLRELDKLLDDTGKENKKND